jgi:hypothetical protein
MFLLSDWWIALSRAKRESVGHCQRCPATKGLQAHHVRYPENWFDTTEDDLEVLCRDCHEREHHITKVVSTPNTPAQAKVWRRWNKRRSFKHNRKKWSKKTRKQKVKEMNRKERLQGLGKVQWKPWQKFRTSPVHHYVNRGTSSN